MKTMIMMLLAFAGSIGIASAQTPAVMVSDAAGWHKIAERTVDFKMDKDEIAVMGSDRFSTIKFKAPGESRVIDLKGGSERSIKKIIFVYKTLPNSKDEKAKVEIWGLKTNTVKK